MLQPHHAIYFSMTASVIKTGNRASQLLTKLIRTQTVKMIGTLNKKKRKKSRSLIFW